MRLVRPVTVHGLAVVTEVLAEVRQLGLAPATAEPCRQAPCSQGGWPGRSCGSPSAGFRRRPACRRCQSSACPGSGLKPHNSRRVAVEFPDQRPLVLKHGDRRALHEPGSRRARASLRAAPPRPAALREPAPGAGGRATSQEKNVLWEPHSVAVFFAVGNTTRGDPVRFFCPARSFIAGRSVRAADLGVESTEIAVPAQRIRSFPHLSKGNSAPLKAVGVSRRYKQRMRLRDDRR